jgi:tripartite-type tricarboxylate transporter receptor subunit TctC
MVAPAGLPRAIVSRLNAAVNDALRTPAVRKRFAALGAEPVGGTPEAFGALIRSEHAKWGDVIRRSGARID